MKKFIWGLGILVCLISGCLKSDSNNGTCSFVDSQVVAPNSEIDSVKKYLALHNITATQQASGVFYTVNTQGTGQAISNLCSVLIVKYTGKLTNGSVFDATGDQAASFQLGQVIVGWQKALPFISKGGKITLYIPPALGYGNFDRTDNTGAVVIPAKSILIFDIELVDIK